MSNNKNLLKTIFCGVEFENPFALSSSPVSNSYEMCSRAFDAGWGAVVYKTLNLEKSFKVVMPSPRLNSFRYQSNKFVGLQNAEQITDRNIEDNLKDLTRLRKEYSKKVIISSIMGFSPEDWSELAKMSEGVGADMLELNFSCPQMARIDAGHRIGQNFDAITKFTEVVKKSVNIPVIAKMTPNLTDMLPAAHAAKAGGADSISAINTVRAISDVCIKNFTPMPTIHGQSGITGFSGPAVRPIAMRFVAELYNDKSLNLPISAIGGIENWEDALKFILLGASHLQVTTAIMRYGYRIVEDMIEGLTDYLIDNKIGSLMELQGKAATKIIDPSEFSNRFQVVSAVDKDKCIGCGQCWISCQDSGNQAMEFDYEKRKASVNEEKCVGCLICKLVCPVENCITHREVDTTITKHAAIF